MEGERGGEGRGGTGRPSLEGEELEVAWENKMSMKKGGGGKVSGGDLLVLFYFFETKEQGLVDWFIRSLDPLFSGNLSKSGWRSSSVQFLLRLLLLRLRLRLRLRLLNSSSVVVCPSVCVSVCAAVLSCTNGLVIPIHVSRKCVTTV